MGLETIAFAALTVGSGIMKMQAARKEAKAVVREGELKAKNQARAVQELAGKQRASYLSSGLTLEGLPSSVLDQTFQLGIEDTSQILSNAKAKSSNIIGAARADFVGSLAAAAGGAFVARGRGLGGGSTQPGTFFSQSELSSHWMPTPSTQIKWK